jgi:hypothetical protein
MGDTIIRPFRPADLATIFECHNVSRIVENARAELDERNALSLAAIGTQELN